MEQRRKYDIVLVGATGFTGALAAAHLAARMPAGSRWAIAGRSERRLEALVSQLPVTAASVAPQMVIADSHDPRAMSELARSAAVVASTVGPYVVHGEPLVGACAAAGTAYADITGEPEFVDRMYVLHDESARESGARLVHCCGFEAVPPDLGALYTVGLLDDPADPVRLRGYLRAAGTFSGGTLHSALHSFARLGPMRAAAAARRPAEPDAPPSPGRAAPARPHRPGTVKGWALALPTIDAQIVRRSARARGQSLAYAHHAVVGRLPTALGIAVAAGAVVGLAQLPPVRARLSGLRAAGEGPTAAQRERGWFDLHLIADGPRQTVAARVSGGDPGYGETAKMLGESTLSLAFDDLPPAAGQLTPAQAMGKALTQRLQHVGIGFEQVPAPTR